MSLEKPDNTNPTNEEILRFIRPESVINLMIQNKEAYASAERNRNGKIKIFRIFDKGGKVIYFEDVEELDSLKKKGKL